MSGFANFSPALLQELTVHMGKGVATDLETILRSLNESDIEKLDINGSKGIKTTIKLSDAAMDVDLIKGLFAGKSKPTWVKGIDNATGSIEIDVAEFLQAAISNIHARHATAASINLKMIYAVLGSFDQQNIQDLDKVSNLFAKNFLVNLIKAFTQFDANYKRLIDEWTSEALVQPAYLGQPETQKPRSPTAGREDSITQAAADALEAVLKLEDPLPVPVLPKDKGGPTRALAKTLSRTASGFSLGRTLSFSRSTATKFDLDLHKEEMAENIAEYRKQLSALIILYPMEMLVMLEEKVLTGPKIRALIKNIEDGDYSDPENPIPKMARQKDGTLIVPEEIRDFYSRLKELQEARSQVEKSIDDILAGVGESKKDSFIMELKANQEDRIAPELKASDMRGVRRASLAVVERSSKERVAARNSIQVAIEQGDMFDLIMQAIQAKFKEFGFNPYNSYQQTKDGIAAETVQSVLAREFNTTFKSGTRTDEEMIRLQTAIEKLKLDLEPNSTDSSANQRKIVEAFVDLFQSVKSESRSKLKLKA